MPATALKHKILTERPADAASITQGMAEAFARARVIGVPFRHWLFEKALPDALCYDIITLPLPVAEFDDTHGKRDTHNESRRFFTPQMQSRFASVGSIAEGFQSAPVVRAIENLCGINLSGSYLRIEYCQDRSGFWLEPHMDIKEKFITMQIYLNTEQDASLLGTDMYDKDKRYHSRADGRLNQGMIFLPKEPESWHGFEKRPIQKIRRSLIINYVTDDWRSRHELSFPEQPVT